ncbi:hypothetical protein [Prochlorococcus marinus]|uniref:hypothetical protein n=1 Tax=Prochlorococcus marinus TaxID=1219 RepID=UPI0022B3C798|nr:hypothetical protein [Prochlorococcus marinus]
MELSPDFARKCREDALRKYEDEQQKFGLEMMMMGYYKVKSLLSQEGLKKVFEIDSKRESDEDFNKRFSEMMWKNTEEAWGQALGQLMIKISDAYGLKMGSDIRMELPEEEEDPKLDFFA